MRFDVNIPAQAAFTSETISARSGRPACLMPHSAVPALKPFGAVIPPGMSFTGCGPPPSVDSINAKAKVRESAPFRTDAPLPSQEKRHFLMLRIA